MSRILVPQPHIQSGYARRASESEYPDLWRDVVFFAPFSMQGDYPAIWDLANPARTFTLFGEMVWRERRYVEFNGIGAHIRIDLALPALTAWTCLYGTAGTAGDATFATIIGRSGNTQSRIIHRLSTSVVESNTVGETLSFTSVPNMSTYQHYAMTDDGTSSRALYVNGVAHASPISYTVAMDWTVVNRLGTSTQLSTNTYDGYLDYIYLYRTNLPVEKIRQLHEFPLAPFVERRRIYSVGGTGPVTVTPSAEAAASSTVNPAVVLGSLSLAPTALAVLSSSPNPAAVLGSLSLAPSALSVVSSTQEPTVAYGSVAVTPANIDAASSVAGPTVDLGPVVVSPAALAVVSSTTDPTVQGGGSVVFSPAAVSANGTAVGPTIVLSSISLTPAALAAASSTVGPTVILGALFLTPSALAAVSAVTDPTVQGGGSVVFSPDAISANGTVIGPTIVLGSLVLAPVALAAASSTINPTIILGSLSFTPSGLAVVSAAVDPSVDAGGNISLTPPPVSANGTALNPGVVFGSVLVVPSAAAVLSGVTGPTLVLGSVSVIPAVLAVSSSAPNPTVINSGPVVMPAAISAQGGTANPTITLGSVVVTPAVSGGLTGVTNPSVLPEIVVESAQVVSNNRTFLPVHQLTQAQLQELSATLGKISTSDVDAEVQGALRQVNQALESIFVMFDRQLSYDSQSRLAVDDAIRALHQRVNLATGAGNLANRPPPAPDGIRFLATDQSPPILYIAKGGVWVTQ